jgi:transposase
MFGDFSNVRIYLKTGKTDFRKSVNGLSILVEETMKLGATSGDLFIFCNRGKNRIKVLYYDRNGFCLWYKRLEEDKFRWPKNVDEVLEITREELVWLMRGLDFRSAHRERRYATVT